MEKDEKTALATFLSERDFVKSSYDPPDSEDSLYVKITSTLNGDESVNYMISGVTLVIDQEHDEQGIFKLLNVDRRTRTTSTEKAAKGSTKHVTLCADRIVVCGEFSLPETDLSISARELVFKDRGDEKGCVNTSPLGYAEKKAADCDPSEKNRTPGKNGAPGRQAGSMGIYVARLRVPEGKSNVAPPRFILKGGSGQDAGLGKNGEDGNSLLSTTNHTWDCGGTCGISHFSMAFDVPAVYIDMVTLWGARTRVGGTTWGSNMWPSSGTDALAPGKPGEGGNGGSFTSNIDLSCYVDNSGGLAGKKATDAKGGKAGTPQECAHWHAEAWDNWFRYPRCLKYDKTETRKTTNGTSYKAPAAERPAGNTPTPICIHDHSAWLHPFQIMSMLGYVQDAYLSGSLDAIRVLLAEYSEALMSLTSKKEAANDLFDPAEFQAFNAEVATLRRRLDAGLDYYGHPAGWTPLLSLPASLGLYKRETGWALRTLMLSEWIEDQSREKTAAAAVLTHAMKELEEDTKNAAEHIANGEELFKTLSQKRESLEKELFDFNAKLSALQEKLLADAKTKESEKAMINLATKTFSAVCSVIPFGQPALSAAGSLPSIIANWDSESPGDNAGKLAGLLSIVAKAKLDDSAAEIVTEANEKIANKGKAPKKIEKEKADKAELEAAKEKAGRLSAIGKKLGPALGQINDAVRGLSVPQGEIDAELARMEAQRPEYAELVKKIKEINARKVAFASKLDRVSMMVGSAYSRIAGNFASGRVLDAQRGTTLALLNHAARLYVSDMGRRAKERLVKYLYYLVKSYESTMLKSCPGINFRMIDVFDKIKDLLKGQGADEKLTAKNLQNFAEDLRPLFDDNRQKIEQALLDDFQEGLRIEHTKIISCRLSKEQTPELIDALNESGEAEIDLKELGLIPPDVERMRIGSISIHGIQLANVTQGGGGTAELGFEPMDDGTMRYGGKLFAVHSRADDGDGLGGQREFWGATFEVEHPKKVKPIVASNESAELLKVLLGETTDEIRTELIKPPAWTKLKVHFRRHMKKNLPELVLVDLDVSLNFTPLMDDTILVLDISASGAGNGSRNMVLTPRIVCSPLDSNDHGDGCGGLYRMYQRGETVTLVAEKLFGRWKFSHWDVKNSSTEEPVKAERTETKLTVVMDANMEAMASYA